MLKKIAKPVVLTGLFLFYLPLFAAVNETLPTWHWAYEYIEQLQIRGHFHNLTQLEKPYTRGDVAEGVITLLKMVNLTSVDQKMARRLEKEFAPEIQALSGEKDSDTIIDGGLHLKTWYDARDENDAGVKSIWRGRGSLSLGEHVTMATSLTFDQYLAEDPLYTGKKWRNLVGYSEQAYITYRDERFFLKFGRDYLKWGIGQSGTLFFSDVAMPMDLFSGSVDFGPFRYTAVATVLDDLLLEETSGEVRATRYIAAHRLNTRLFDGRLEIAVTEAVLYGGKNRQLDYVYLNPMMVFYGAELNRSVQDNKFAGVDIIGRPLKHLQLYGSLLIDDIQVEKTGPGDLEPNEIGYIAGGDWADPFGLAGMTIGAEYTRVTNRTYKTAYSWESFLHRNRPLGHPFGNDFDHMQMSVQKWFNSSLWVRAAVSQTRHGEGSLYTPWDDPWIAYTVDEGYSEPFPFGVVETTRRLGLEVKVQPSVHWGIEAEAYAWWRANAGNVEGVSEDGVAWRVGVWVDGGVGFLW